jgi:HAD superfamily hydrolase (TIGR01509 family)
MASSAASDRPRPAPVPPRGAVVFDLDDTLIASERARMRKLGALLGPGADLRRVRAIAEECWAAYQRGDCSWAEQRRRRWTAIGVLESRAVELDDEYRSHYRTIRIRPGARALLTGLKQRGIRLALVSNALPSYVEARLHEHRLEGYFDHVFQMVPPRRKPQTEVFEEAAERLRVRPEATVVAGNDLQLDILPALRAGYRHGYWMSSAAGAAIPAVTRVRTCAQLAAILVG